MNIISPSREDEKLLNAEKRIRIADALKENPSRSDRVIARETATSQPTVYRVRKEMEGSGTIEAIKPESRRRATIGDRKSYSQKIRALVAEELKRDPLRSDRAIALVTKTASNTVWTVRREMENAGLIPRTKAAQRVSQLGKLGTSTNQGQRISPPDGLSVTEYIERGMNLESEEGLGGEQAAKRIGITPATYRKIRSAVLLASNPDLNMGDRLIVTDILKKINADRFIGKYWEDLRPIVAKVWGGEKGTNERTLRKRKAVFQNALSLLTNTCAHAPEVEVPLLSEEERYEASGQLTEAIQNLTKLRGKVRRGL